MKRTNSILFGLFPYRGRYFFKNIKHIPILFKRVGFVLKHGYPPQARWETFDWFINVMKDILSNYRDHRCGTPSLYSIEEYNVVLSEMIDLLNHMDECNPIYENIDFKEQNKQMEEAKDKFFKLFSEHFYSLWD